MRQQVFILNDVMCKKVQEKARIFRAFSGFSILDILKFTRIFT